ncbi:peroxisomal membrane anchor protein conserved region-domain-containing protein [Xylariaceae sp. AK1471]|nr:peroxisomal membrane anchor protein conserved region-domain-containing protein [Xylariaceae sp. AK1471]
MSDSEKPSIPAWQQAESHAASEPAEMTLEHARRFLNDKTVKAATPEEKRVFLKSKGLDDAQITKLLDELREESQTSASQSATESSATPDDVPADQKIETDTETKEASSTSADSSSSGSSSAVYPTASSPPIITYPEFLTKPQRPPPLITPSRLAHILAVSGTVWALLYGIAGLAIRPMVDNLNDARSEYYAHANEKLAQLVEKLERMVSKVPYKDGKPPKSQHQDRAIDDNESITSDPTELFHRDVGTQTSPPPSTIGTMSYTTNSTEKPVEVQVRKLSAISASLRELTHIHTQRAESIADLGSTVRELRDQVDKLAYPPVQDFSTYGGLGYGRSAEPDDEFKKTKDAIRSVKGLLLSTRSFPAVTTR